MVTPVTYLEGDDLSPCRAEWQDNDLIFPSTIGTPNDRDNLRKRFKAVLIEAGLPEIRFHDLRHTAVAWPPNSTKTKRSCIAHG
jgi:integrase